MYTLTTTRGTVSDDEALQVAEWLVRSQKEYEGEQFMVPQEPDADGIVFGHLWTPNKERTRASLTHRTIEAMVELNGDVV